MAALNYDGYESVCAHSTEYNCTSWEILQVEENSAIDLIRQMSVNHQPLQ